ncbi:hypothetical protein [Aurantiacibacter gilvus]|uniref:Uncharacterized protein n=1 Tax=Aurantiacibacter gilvus TaxID=3139141 RepID=A0ABU9IDG0_9SPHN
MSKFRYLAFAPRTFDLLFTIQGAIGFAMIALRTGQVSTVPETAADPLVKAASLAGLVLVAAVVASLSSRIDQKRADDYMFATLTKSAFIAVLAMLCIGLLWIAWFADTFGDLGAVSMLACTMASWSLGYLYTRLRGTTA